MVFRRRLRCVVVGVGCVFNVHIDDTTVDALRAAVDQAIKNMIKAYEDSLEDGEEDKEASASGGETKEASEEHGGIQPTVSRRSWTDDSQGQEEQDDSSSATGLRPAPATGSAPLVVVPQEQEKVPELQLFFAQAKCDCGECSECCGCCGCCGRYCGCIILCITGRVIKARTWIKSDGRNGLALKRGAIPCGVKEILAKTNPIDQDVYLPTTDFPCDDTAKYIHVLIDNVPPDVIRKLRLAYDKKRRYFQMLKLDDQSRDKAWWSWWAAVFGVVCGMYLYCSNENFLQGIVEDFRPDTVRFYTVELWRVLFWAMPLIAGILARGKDVCDADFKIHQTHLDYGTFATNE